MLDSKLLLSSLQSHLDSMQETAMWALALALLVGWAGLRGQQKLEVAGISMSRRAAFSVAAFLYFAANVVVLLNLLRIESILISVDRASYLKAYTTLAADDWLLNPFAFLGTSSAARWSSQFGIALLIVGWWLCLASVASIRHKQSMWRNPAIASFYFIGLATLWEFWRIYQLNLSRLRATAHEDVVVALINTRMERWIAILSAPVVGLVLFLIVSTRRNGTQRDTR